MVNIRDAIIYASRNGGERGPPKALHKPSSSPPPPPPMGEVKEGSVFMSSGDHGTLIMVPWVWRRSRSRSPKAYGPNWSKKKKKKQNIRRGRRR